MIGSHILKTAIIIINLLLYTFIMLHKLYEKTISIKIKIKHTLIIKK